MSKIEVTDTQIKQWKKKYGEVHLVTVPLDDEGKKGKVAIGYFHKPSLETISAAGKFADDDPIKSGMIIFDNTLLSADPELTSSDEAKISAIQAVSELFKVRQAKIKKL